MLLSSSKQPEIYAELLHRSLNLYLNAFKKTAWLSLVLAVVIFMPHIVLVLLAPHLLNEWSSMPVGIFLLAIYIGFFWVLAANFWHMHCVYKHKKDNFFSDFKAARQKIIYILIAALLLFIIGAALSSSTYGFYWLLQINNLFDPQNTPRLFIGSTLLFLQTLLACYVCLLFYFYLPLIVTKNDKPVFSLLDSARLAWGNMWNIVSVQITPWLVYLTVLILIKLAIGINVHIYFMQDLEQEGLLASILATVMHIIIFAIFAPWSIAATIVQLHDLELRQKLRKK